MAPSRLRQIARPKSRAGEVRADAAPARTLDIARPHPSSSGIPRPVSSTQNTTSVAASSVQPMVTDPSSVYRSALLARFNSTRASADE